MSAASITIPWAPSFSLGPIEMTWHGTMIAAGVALAAVVAARLVRARGLSPDPLWTLACLMVVAGIAGSRILFFVQESPASLLRPHEWFGSHGYSIYGAVIAGAVAGGLYAWRRHLDLRYLGALAAAFPLGDAVGRIGDLISGEHYGSATSVPWGVRYTDVAAHVPETGVVYHSGALYEIVLGLVVFPLVLIVWRRVNRPLAALWAVLVLFGVGRFLIFFWRADSDPAALGLVESQWISLALVVVGVAALIGSRLARIHGISRAPSPGFHS